MVSDGPGALCGTVFTPFGHFALWSVDDDGHPVKQPAVRDADQPIMLLHGIFPHARFLELVTGYVAFARGDGRAGVVWHTQGSAKSLEMELYASQVLTHPSLGNPTIVVLTDRTDLDDQLYDAFASSDLLPERPVQVATREELRAELANRRMGGIIFTTLQKFGRTKQERENGWPHPLLSDRRNVIVIVDEAHRSHYGDLNGYARHLRDALPHAAFIAFTGTPVSFADRNTAGLDDSERERLAQRVAAMNRVYGAPDRGRPPSPRWQARLPAGRREGGHPARPGPDGNLRRRMVPPGRAISSRDEDPGHPARRVWYIGALATRYRHAEHMHELPSGRH